MHTPFHRDPDFFLTLQLANSNGESSRSFFRRVDKAKNSVLFVAIVIMFVFCSCGSPDGVVAGYYVYPPTADPIKTRIRHRDKLIVALSRSIYSTSLT